MSLRFHRGGCQPDAGDPESREDAPIRSPRAHTGLSGLTVSFTQRRQDAKNGACISDFFACATRNAILNLRKIGGARLAEAMSVCLFLPRQLQLSPMSGNGRRHRDETRKAVCLVWSEIADAGRKGLNCATTGNSRDEEFTPCRCLSWFRRLKRIDGFTIHPRSRSATCFDQDGRLSGRRRLLLAVGEI